MSTLVKVCKRDPVAYKLSNFYVNKTLRNISKEVSQNIKHSWVPPSKYLVHQDKKTRTSLDGGDHEKRIAVFVSGVKWIKLLGVSSIETKLKRKYDSTASSAIMKELYTLKCTHKVVVMVFDTTSAKSSACFLLQKIWHINL